jgi:hypothetical protein
MTGVFCVATPCLTKEYVMNTAIKGESLRPEREKILDMALRHGAYGMKFFCSTVIGLVLMALSGCLGPPETPKTSSPVAFHTSPSAASPVPLPTFTPTVEYESFLVEGADKVLEGQYKEAIPPLLKARDTKPRDGQAHFWLFNAYKNTEQKPSRQSNSCIEARKVIALMPGSPQAKQAELFVRNVDPSWQKQTEKKQPMNPPPQQQTSSQPGQNEPPPLSPGGTMSVGNKVEYVPAYDAVDPKQAREDYEKRLRESGKIVDKSQEENWRRNYEEQRKQRELYYKTHYK